jgi:hypothetical protein
MLLVFAKAFGAPFVFLAALDLELVLPFTGFLDDSFALAFGVVGNAMAPKRALMYSARQSRFARRH